MAVSVPGAKLHDTWSTATWPPKRMVRLRVSSMRGSGAAADYVVVRARLLQRRGRVDIPQPHVLVRAVGVGVAKVGIRAARGGVRVVAGGVASGGAAGGG